ncbi:MAG: hypothetical protein HY000_05255 [Planctomycetes bacterium]|nr:hypothetical protein [Planctomycetota bacterium]
MSDKQRTTFDYESLGPDGDITTTSDNQLARTAYNSRKLATHTRDPLGPPDRPADRGCLPIVGFTFLSRTRES